MPRVSIHSTHVLGKELTEVGSLTEDGKEHQIWQLQHSLHYAASVQDSDLDKEIAENADKLDEVDEVREQPLCCAAKISRHDPFRFATTARVAAPALRSLLRLQRQRLEGTPATRRGCCTLPDWSMHCNMPCFLSSCLMLVQIFCSSPRMARRSRRFISLRVWDMRISRRS